MKGCNTKEVEIKDEIAVLVPRMGKYPEGEVGKAIIRHAAEIRAEEIARVAGRRQVWGGRAG